MIAMVADGFGRDDGFRAALGAEGEVIDELGWGPEGIVTAAAEEIDIDPWIVDAPVVGRRGGFRVGWIVVGRDLEDGLTFRAIEQAIDHTVRGFEGFITFGAFECDHGSPL